MEFINTFLDKVDHFFSLSPEGIGKGDYPAIRLENNGNVKTKQLDDTLEQARNNDMLIIEPENFEESQDIVEKLKKNQPIILNFSSTDHQVATRLIDFISGAIYALNGNVEKIGDSVFLFTSKEINITYKSRNRSDFKSESKLETGGLSKKEKESLYER